MEQGMKGIERGCGVREPGGIYFESGRCKGVSDVCRPVEDFLFDPPLPVGDLEIPARGVLILERPDGSGIHDVYDRVGESGYPNVADMVEEIKKYGLSRRANRGIDFSLIQPGSMIFLIHPHAILANHADLYRMIAAEAKETPHAVTPFRCPCRKAAHAKLPAKPHAMCAGLWWETLAKADANFDLSAPRRSCFRQSGSTKYAGRHAPHGFKPEWQPGIFARFPLRRIVVVADPEGGEDEKARQRASMSGLDVIDVEY